VDEFATCHSLKAGSAHVGYRKAGNGPALVLLHGYPLSSYTWRKMIPELSRQFTCYAFDVVGFGESHSTDSEDFSSQGEAMVFQRSLSALQVDSYALLGNNSGGWIARELALLDSGHVTRMILTNTEIPHHRPPWIGFYQFVTRVVGGRTLFRALLKSDIWRRSEMGFGGCFQDRDLIDEEFARAYLVPLISSDELLSRVLEFLNKMDFKRVDSFEQLHRQLAMPVGFVWGADDPTFPESLARSMATQFPNVLGFASVPRGKLFMHEEIPGAVLRPLLNFLKP
jgi:haloalkane dehalogenase